MVRNKEVNVPKQANLKGLWFKNISTKTLARVCLQTLAKKFFCVSADTLSKKVKYSSK